MGSIEKNEATELEFLKVFESFKEDNPGYASYVFSERKHIERYGSRKYECYSDFLKSLKNEFVKFKL